MDKIIIVEIINTIYIRDILTLNPIELHEIHAVFFWLPRIRILYNRIDMCYTSMYLYTCVLRAY